MWGLTNCRKKAPLWKSLHFLRFWLSAIATRQSKKKEIEFSSKWGFFFRQLVKPNAVKRSIILPYRSTILSLIHLFLTHNPIRNQFEIKSIGWSSSSNSFRIPLKMMEVATLEASVNSTAWHQSAIKVPFNLHHFSWRNENIKLMVALSTTTISVVNGSQHGASGTKHGWTN